MCDADDNDDGHRLNPLRSVNECDPKASISTMMVYVRVLMDGWMDRWIVVYLTGGICRRYKCWPTNMRPRSASRRDTRFNWARPRSWVLMVSPYVPCQSLAPACVVSSSLHLTTRMAGCCSGSTWCRTTNLRKISTRHSSTTNAARRSWCCVNKSTSTTPSYSNTWHTATDWMNRID